MPLFRRLRVMWTRLQAEGGGSRPPIGLREDDFVNADVRCMWAMIEASSCPYSRHVVPPSSRFGVATR